MDEPEISSLRISRGKRLKEIFEAMPQVRRTTLANSANVTEKTIENLFAGRNVSENTVKSVCITLRQNYDQFRIDNFDPCSLAEFGSYTRSKVSKYEGTYVCYRRAFSLPGMLFRSIFTVRWDYLRPGLLFDEYHKYELYGHAQNYSQIGRVYVCAEIGTIQLLSKKDDDLRLITLKAMRPGDSWLRGAVLTQGATKAVYTPLIGAVVFFKVEIDRARLGDDQIGDLAALVGPVDPTDSAFAPALKELVTTEQSIIKFNLPSAAE